VSAHIVKVVKDPQGNNPSSDFFETIRINCGENTDFW